jgi:Holliday junction resolvase
MTVSTQPIQPRSNQPANATGAPLRRALKPFSATGASHTLVRAAEQLGWNLKDPEKFIRQVQHVEYGLSSEMEFAAILRWLGWCSFVHRLNDDVLEDPSRSSWQVPDLFAVFETGGQKCTAMIEVKTSEDMILKFKESYLQQLRAYAEMMKQPLLIAWRPRTVGFWILFDPQIARRVDAETLEVDFELAVKNDLMSILAGDYYIVPEEGAGLRLEYERIGEKQPKKDGYEALFRVSDAYFHDAAGSRTKKVPDSIVWTIFATVKDVQEVSDNHIVQSFVASGGMTRAQMVLRTAAGFSLKDEERVHWKQVGKNLDAVLGCETLLRDAQVRFGTFISYILHLQPAEMPAFLPASWRGRRRCDG